LIRHAYFRHCHISFIFADTLSQADIFTIFSFTPFQFSLFDIFLDYFSCHFLLSLRFHFFILIAFVFIIY